ncbi:hypothetical protein yc1106_00851 [Curvularia clavata]|uniref:BZIP domain-containing protein n=1 Tax=Curvularia clavata TaxID=95742 RepID=A0A9Q8Z0R3_CURCL|nr:hypothetical protein yc1106_00851 [Curvularia clavata]
MASFEINDSDLTGFQGKVALITGGSSGIGLATVELLVSLGALVTDVRNWSELTKLFKAAKEKHGKIDYVFANAGIGPRADYLSLQVDQNGDPIEPNQDTIDINLDSVVKTVTLAAHYLKTQAEGGSIVIMGSSTGLHPVRAVDYSTAKAGVLGFGRSFARLVEVAGLPIRVNTLAPSWTATQVLPDLKNLLAAVSHDCQSAAVVARAVAYLMADKSRHGELIFASNGKYTEIEKTILAPAYASIKGDDLSDDAVLAKAYGIYLSHYLAEDIFPDASTWDYSFIGGFNFSIAMLIAPGVTILVRRIGIHPTMTLGLTLQSTGFIAASFATRIWHFSSTFTINTMPSPPPLVPHPRSRSKTKLSTNKTADLERIRNNQRRCRARQKAYISNLESKIRDLEGASVESRTQKKLEELVEENASLKRLLQSLGLRDEFLDKYHAAMRMVPNVSLPSGDCGRAKQRLDGLTATEAVQIPHMASNVDHTAGAFPDTLILEQDSLDLSQTDASLPWDLIDFSAASTSVSESAEANFHIQQLGDLAQDAFSTKESGNVENTSDTTTLCSWAFSLVLKSNRKGYSVADLDLKLRVGYRCGATPNSVSAQIDSYMAWGDTKALIVWRSEITLSPHVYEDSNLAAQYTLGIVSTSSTRLDMPRRLTDSTNP